MWRRFHSDCDWSCMLVMFQQAQVSIFTLLMAWAYMCFIYISVCSLCECPGTWLYNTVHSPQGSGWGRGLNGNSHNKRSCLIKYFQDKLNFVDSYETCMRFVFNPDNVGNIISMDTKKEERCLKSNGSVVHVFVWNLIVLPGCGVQPCDVVQSAIHHQPAVITHI